MANQIETIISVQTEGRNRATVLFRPILAFPVYIFAASFTSLAHWGISSTVLTVPVILALVFRGVYPSYILNFNHAMLELGTRLIAYMLFLTDDYPSIEANSKFAVLIPDVESGRKLSRWKPIFKVIFSIPLVLVGILYSIAAAIMSIFAWVHILLTGKYPDFAINIVVGTLKFWNRVVGYAGVLVTDEYPTFRL